MRFRQLTGHSTNRRPGKRRGWERGRGQERRKQPLVDVMCCQGTSANRRPESDGGRKEGVAGEQEGTPVGVACCHSNGKGASPYTSCTGSTACVHTYAQTGIHVNRFTHMHVHTCSSSLPHTHMHVPTHVFAPACLFAHVHPASVPTVLSSPSPAAWGLSHVRETRMHAYLHRLCPGCTWICHQPSPPTVPVVTPLKCLTILETGQGP